jgi:ATP-dependent DNA helicase DinG
MKYESQIIGAFNRLGFSPRDGQVSAINQILEAFVDDKIKNVILNASTGTGKSIIGAVTAEALAAIRGKRSEDTKASIMLTATNVLAKQYESSFAQLAKPGVEQYIMLKGAGNYDCEAMSTPDEPATGESCAWFTMVQNSSEFQHILDTSCAKCEYMNTKKYKNGVRHLTTNYSYYFVDRMYTGKFEDRDVVVWDEAHLINDLFSEHNAIFFSQKSVQKTAQDIADKVQLTDMDIAKILKTVQQDVAIKGKINDGNYKTYLQAMHKVYKYAKERGAIQVEKALRSRQTSRYTALNRFVREYEGKLCKIDDLFNFNYDHVFEYKEEEKAVSVKPVFVGNMMEALECGDESKNLFMSATITNDIMTRTLKLDPARTRFIKLPPTFPKENKEVVFLDPLSLNFTSLKDPATIKKLCANVSKIVKHHVANGERGIILTPSFKLTQDIVAEIKKISGYTLFEHRQGEKLENILNAFKAHQGMAILISPSMFEGVDLPGDLSRFQVMVKAPFPSLGDKRMKYILDHHPDLYNAITIMKMVQGAGRSVRSIDDHATTYILDLNGKRLFTSSANIWQDEFKIRFASAL